jgi:hypothetical protein
MRLKFSYTCIKKERFEAYDKWKEGEGVKEWRKGEKGVARKSEGVGRRRGVGEDSVTASGEMKREREGERNIDKKK